MKKLFLFIFNFVIFLLLFSIILKYSSAACIDSDSSEYPTINYNQQGTAIAESDYLVDYCTANVLVEYYCNSADEGRVFNTIYSCGDGCGDGVCKEVVENPPKTLPPPPDSGVPGPVLKGQSADGGASENSEPSPNDNPSILPVPDNPVKDESLFTRIVKLLASNLTTPSANSGLGLIIILFVLVLISLYLFRKKLSKKFW